MSVSSPTGTRGRRPLGEHSGCAERGSASGSVRSARRGAAAAPSSALPAPRALAQFLNWGALLHKNDTCARQVGRHGGRDLRGEGGGRSAAGGLLH
eukprot:815172-Pyramimonas_sp.AAC.1